MDSFLGLPVTPTQFLTISLISSLLSTIFKSIKMIKLEKGFLRFKPKLMVGIWSGFAAIRKVSSIVAFFTPSLGLFSILHHWQYENIPFKVRLEQAPLYIVMIRYTFKIPKLLFTIQLSKLPGLHLIIGAMMNLFVQDLHHHPCTLSYLRKVHFLHMFFFASCKL